MLKTLKRKSERNLYKFRDYTCIAQKMKLDTNGNSRYNFTLFKNTSFLGETTIQTSSPSETAYNVIVNHAIQYDEIFSKLYTSGGYREKTILELCSFCEWYREDPTTKRMKFCTSNGNYCIFNFATNRWEN